MKIYITSYTDPYDGAEYAGPNIHADSLDDATIVADKHGLNVCGELTDILQDIVNVEFVDDLKDRVLH